MNYTSNKASYSVSVSNLNYRYGSYSSLLIGPCGLLAQAPSLQSQVHLLCECGWWSLSPLLSLPLLHSYLLVRAHECLAGAQLGEGTISLPLTCQSDGEQPMTCHLQGHPGQGHLGLWNPWRPFPCSFVSSHTLVMFREIYFLSF